MLQQVAAMRQAIPEGVGPDVIIVTVSSPALVDFWRRRLERLRGLIIKRNAQIWVLHEDWPRGAGTALGTLDVYRRVRHLNFEDRAVFLYHAAGKGSRLEPLTSLEGGCKASVKLPARLLDQPIALLEAVILQTAFLAPLWRGRLGVFWTDQLFVPALPLNVPTAHADLLVSFGRPLEASESYGQVALSATGRVQLVEKVSASRFEQLGVCCARGRGSSLGSFSISHRLLNTLVEEFAPELSRRGKGSDAERYFWMPLSLEPSVYCALSGSSAAAHQRRLCAVTEGLGGPILGATDIGAKGYWWDFGRLSTYCGHLKKFSCGDQEALALQTLLR